LLRRALLHAYLLGLEEPALHRLVEPVVDVMGDVYKHLPPQRSFVEGVIRGEEENYFSTLVPSWPPSRRAGFCPERRPSLSTTPTAFRSK
jgi:hypothetical protein